ncbi:MAG: DUF1801 domain-containing protein [Acidimicrobiales bacterium]
MKDPDSIGEPQVASVFASYPEPVRRRLLAVRRLILDTADATAGVGTIEETLKWGQPSYLTAESGSGSTIRVAPTTSPGADYAMFFICHTNLVSDFRALFGDRLSYEGNRGLLFSADEEIPEDEVRRCIEMAFTYHQRKAPR